MWTELLFEGFHATCRVELMVGSRPVWARERRFGVNGRWIPGAPSSLSMGWLDEKLPDSGDLTQADGIRITTFRS